MKVIAMAASPRDASEQRTPNMDDDASAELGSCVPAFVYEQRSDIMDTWLRKESDTDSCADELPL